MAVDRVVTSRAQETDEQLALAVQAGDRSAEAELVDRFTGLAYTLAFPYLTLRSDRDDMRQEALLGILAAARSYRAAGGASFKSLAVLAIRRRLFTVITTDNRKSRKAAKTPVAINAPVDLDDGESTLEEIVADPFAVDPHAALIQSEQLRTLVAALRDSLSALEIDAAIAFFFNGDTYEEIAARRGSTAKSIDNAILRVRGKLRLALDLPEPRPLGVAA